MALCFARPALGIKHSAMGRQYFLFEPMTSRERVLTALGKTFSLRAPLGAQEDSPQPIWFAELGSS